jgi:hypothetical protein
MSAVFIVHVDYRKGGGETLGPFSTREKAVEAVMATSDNWKSYIAQGFCDPANGFWGSEDESYQIEERSIQ